MNEIVRTYLIKSSRARIPVAYNQINKDCGLDLNLELVSDRKVLSNTLGEISLHEYENNRPLLSAVAMYQNLLEHGDGFYQICQDLGIGSKKELKEREFAVSQMMECFDYWSKTAEDDFFVEGELDFFYKWGYQIYDPSSPEHFAVKEKLMSTVWLKTGNWAKKVIEDFPEYQHESKKVWSQKGWDDIDGVKRQAARIKNYTWAKIFLKGQDDRDIFFTVGLSAVHYKFEVKIDFKRGLSKLNKLQKQICLDFLGENNPKPVSVPFSSLLTWGDIVNLAREFIKENENKYLQLIDLVWNTSYSATYSDRTKVDYEAKNRNARILGQIGEKIVLELERTKVKKKFPDKVDGIKQVKDSYGFDICSYDDYGNDIMIEVKSTTRSFDEPFYMSRNQKGVSEDNAIKYYIYRIYDLDITQNPIRYNLKMYLAADHIINFEPIEFEVRIGASVIPN
ncbi:hypothetical protein HDF26_004015 [Pedobacter cryoconitis]|uniref:DUF3883 domain-containing protein n=1 Tax=Pedobacter cryoconitis TaxID=188932 RepID=UPI00161B8FEC|nr:DUF3883 domain-containing protein [Pedobacter cryoconitis]MBB6273555.1 hypothetical protein [Pedobacter cryoconitis]